MSGRPAFHAGQLAVQTRAGVTWPPEQLAAADRESVISAGIAAFIARQPLAAVVASGHDGRPWTSIVAGRPGLVRPLSALRLDLDLQVPATDPLRSVVQPGFPLGLLSIDLERRARVKVKGFCDSTGPDRASIRVERAYGLCSNHINERVFVGLARSHAPAVTSRSTTLDTGQVAFIGGADICFIGTASFEYGGDVAHRGGPAGFVHVLDDSTIVIPDYSGNDRFDTLGNIALSGRCGMAFPDLLGGRLLQVTGEATIDWSPDSNVTGDAPRAVKVRIVAVSDSSAAFPARWVRRMGNPLETRLGEA